MLTLVHLRSYVDVVVCRHAVAEDKLREAQQTVHKCHKEVLNAFKLRTTAWKRWRAAQEEYGSSNLIRQHIRAEQQLQHAADTALELMQVFST